MSIKNIIITVLTILLIIVVCFYCYLASQMQDYEKKRLEYIINKENELNQKENEINKGKVCQVELNNCEITKNNLINMSLQEQNQEQYPQIYLEQEQYEDSVEPNL